MTTTSQVQRAMNEKRQKLAADAAFHRLLEFYRAKVEQGAVLKRTYTLPPLDTVGREIYRGLAPGKASA